VAIIAEHDTEHRRSPTVGSVVKMKIIRSASLAIIVALALLAGFASTANAESGAGPAASAVSDPVDPGLPPD